MSKRRGAYFLANDRVLELAIAFLNSFRHYNPDLPLCLVPYDSNIDRLMELSDRYSFAVYGDGAALARCDDISTEFHNRTCGEYRKLAMWSGDFDEFAYIDIDTIVLHEVESLFRFLSDYEFITSHSNIPHIRKWVWKSSIYDSGLLTAQQIAFAANTGFILSKRRMLTFDGVQQALQKAHRLAPHMELLCKEQPFLNYLIVSSGKRYTSLLTLARSGGKTEIPLEVWAGMWFTNVRDGKVMRMPGESPILLVHWAGEWHKGYHYGHPLWRFYREFETTPMALGLTNYTNAVDGWRVCEACGHLVKATPRTMKS